MLLSLLLLGCLVNTDLYEQQQARLDSEGGEDGGVGGDSDTAAGATDSGQSDSGAAGTGDSGSTSGADTGAKSGDAGGDDTGAVDGDGDGYAEPDDCDDTNPDVHPLAGDTYGDGNDTDCDGLDCQAMLVDGAYLAVCSLGESTPVDWATARSSCINAGGDELASVRSTEEDAALLDMARTVLSDTADDALWIGYTDAATEATWVWTDGSSGGYENWGGGGPDNGGGGEEEDCASVSVHIDDGGGWNDFPCTRENALFACEVRSAEK